MSKYHPFKLKITTFYKGVKRVREASYLTISNKIEDNNNYCILISQRIKKNEAITLGKSKSYLNIGDIFYDYEKNVFYIYSLIKERNSNGIKSVGFEKVVIDDNNEKVIHLYDFLKELNNVDKTLKYTGNVFTDEGVKQIMFYTIKKFKQKNMYKTINRLNKILEMKKKRIFDVYLMLNMKNKKGVMSYSYESIFHKPRLIKVINGWDIILSYMLKDFFYEIKQDNSDENNNYFYSITGTLIHFNETKKELFIKEKQYKDLFDRIEKDEECFNLFCKIRDMLIFLNNNGNISYYSFADNEFYLLNSSRYLFYLNSELYEHIHHFKYEEKFNETIIYLI